MFAVVATTSSRPVAPGPGSKVGPEEEGEEEEEATMELEVKEEEEVEATVDSVCLRYQHWNEEVRKVRMRKRVMRK